MKVACYRVPPDPVPVFHERVRQKAAAGHWVRVGRQVVCVSGPDYEEPEPPGWERLGAYDLDHTGRRHVVVQNGRRLQQEHPSVLVIADQERVLLVDLDPQVTTTLASARRACYGIEPVVWDAAILDPLDGSAWRRSSLEWVRELVATVRTDQLGRDLAYLAGMPTRHSTTAAYAAAARWAQHRLHEMGWEARREAIETPEGPCENVVGERIGQGPLPRDLVLVTAHLDSINAGGGPDSAAPGADDNASGAAGLLAVANAFRSHNGRHDVRLVLFGGEEQGLLGSQQYVARLAEADRARIQAVVNMD